MVIQQPPQLYTIDDFRQFISLPENEDRLFELIDGQISEVPLETTKHSEYENLLAVAVHIFCRAHKIACHTSGGDGAYNVQGHVIAPDFAYKTTPMSDEYPDPVPPLWAVEIISPTDKAKDIRQKRKVYLDAGILLWEMYPQLTLIDVYTPNKPESSFGIDGVLELGDILPGFKLALRDIFARAE